jgi:hypothetical protein
MVKMRNPWMYMDYDTDKPFLRTARVADGTFVMELPEWFPIKRDNLL